MIATETASVSRPQLARQTKDRQWTPELHRADAADLEWYLGPGQTRFDRSIFGAMLEMVAIHRYTSERCRKCEGLGILGNGDWCPKCNGVGHLPVAKKANRNPVTVRVPPPSHYSCIAYRMGENEEALQRFARVSRQLGRVSRVSRMAARVLCAYHGDNGARWGRTEHQRIFAVYPLTPAGAKLLRGLGNDGPDLSETERLGIQANLEQLQPHRQRGALLEAAAEQANAMYAEAVTIWNDVKGKRG